jgi:GGDEF domain-containing protein
MVLLAVVDRALILYGARTATVNSARELLAILLPVNLAVLAFMPDGGPLSRAIKAWVGGFVVQIAAVAVALRVVARPLAYGMALPIFPVAHLDRLRIPQLALIAFLAVITLMVMLALRPRETGTRGILWATIASFIALNASSPANRTLYFAAAGLGLVVAMVESSYALAFQDDLTGLPGRRAFNQALARLSGGFVVAMVDVDHFKKFNDQYGHDVGDQVLKLVANRLADIGHGGKAFRYGGEEFAVVFPSAAMADAEPHLDAVRKNVEGTTFTLRGRNRPKRPDAAGRGRGPKRRDISVTVSIGAAASIKSKEPNAVVKAADQALYQAKEEGRNRVVVAG